MFSFLYGKKELSNPYMTSRKTIALTKQTFVGKVMSLLFNMLSRLIIAFLSRSKFLLISWLQSPSTVILELPHPWDSPGKNTGVGCHFLLQCRKVKSESEDAQSCPTLHDPMDCSLPGSSIHGIFQARVLEWGAIALTLLGNCSKVVACFCTLSLRSVIILS